MPHAIVGGGGGAVSAGASVHTQGSHLPVLLAITSMHVRMHGPRKG